MAVVATALAFPASASAAALVPLAPSSSWGSEPIHAASPPGDPRLFVVERGGAVRIVADGVPVAMPFLTVPNVDTAGERGLLSIVFPPDYTTSGLFYVFTVAKVADAFGGPGDVRVVEYSRSANPDLADPASARLVLSRAHSATNHNGGQLVFGPDGHLYVTIGDNATASNAQDLSNDLGKILRIDPREQPGGAPFGVPASNPFVGVSGAMPEIYALGLRNPYRASFTPGGDLVLPDVGQTTWEEVNLGKATGTSAATGLAGANLGWPNCEGFCTPPNPSFADPVFQYGHGPTPPETTGCAIIGGHVVRDPALTGLTGRYLYGDVCREDLRSLDLAMPGADPRPAGLSLDAGVPIGFGEDGRGCIYVMAASTAYRVAPTASSSAACPATAAGGGGAVGDPAATIPPAADSVAPRLTLFGARRQPLRRVVPVFARCDEPCTLRAAGSLALPARAATTSAATTAVRRSGDPGEWVQLPVRIRRGHFRWAKRALRGSLEAIMWVRVKATDSSGNGSEEGIRIRLRDAAP